MGTAFLHPFFWWAGVLGLSMLLFVITKVEKKLQALYCGFIAGTTKMLLILSWFWSVYPLEWIGTFDPFFELLAIGWVWMSVSVVLGLGVGCFSVIAFILFQRSYSWLSVPLAYAGSEILGSLFFSLYAMGAVSGLNIHFSFGYLGYTFARHGILSYLALGSGVYILSILGAALAFMLMMIFRRSSEYPSGITKTGAGALILLGILFISYFIPLNFSTSPERTRIASVNTEFHHSQNMSVSERADQVRTLLAAFEAALTTGSEMVVFPEGAHALGVFGTPQDVFAFIQSRTRKNVIVVDSENRKEANGRVVIRGNIYNTKSQTVHHTYKNYLVPSGEFVPYSISGLLSLFGKDEVVKKLENRMTFGTSNLDEELAPQEYLPGVLFCSESLSPFAIREAMNGLKNPHIVHPVSHAWFHTPTMLWYQLDLMLRTQVRLARTPLVQSGNMSVSTAYDAYGNEVTGTMIYEAPRVRVIEYSL